MSEADIFKFSYLLRGFHIKAIFQRHRLDFVFQALANGVKNPPNPSLERLMRWGVEPGVWPHSGADRWTIVDRGSPFTSDESWV